MRVTAVLLVVLVGLSTHANAQWIFGIDGAVTYDTFTVINGTCDEIVCSNGGQCDLVDGDAVCTCSAEYATFECSTDDACCYQAYH